ncbi:MAG: hypothetical protein MK171_05855 [Pirellulales bacterium]|nr:hypothetical protein [Pirellulales bacterium]
MPITCKIAPYRIRRLLLAALACLLLGLWGIYDYTVSAPAKRRQSDQYTLLKNIKAVLDTDPSALTYKPLLLAAQSATQQELQTILVKRSAELGTAIREPADPDYASWLLLLLANTNKNIPPPKSMEPGDVRADARRMTDSMRGDPRFGWFCNVVVNACALQRPRQPGEPLQDICLVAHSTASQLLASMGVPNAPNTFDQLAQWLFLLGIPLTPYLVWLTITSRHQAFQLEEDGSLAFHGSHWPSQDIIDIDMSQWLSQSIAYLVHRDGTRIKLDDFHYQNLFEIVGIFAARFYPEKWTIDGRRVEHDTVESSGNSRGK